MLKMELDATFTVHFLQHVKFVLWLQKYERVQVQGDSRDRCESSDSSGHGMVICCCHQPDDGGKRG